MSVRTNLTVRESCPYYENGARERDPNAQKIMGIWEGRVLSNQNLSLRSLSIRDNDLLSETLARQDGENLPLDKLQNGQKKELLDAISNVLSEALSRNDVKELIAQNGGKFKFALSKREGFVIKSGNSSIKICEYSDFFVLEDVPLHINRFDHIRVAWRTVELSEKQKLFRIAKAADRYVEKTSLCRARVKETLSDTDRKVAAVFDRATKLVKEENQALVEVFFSRHEGKWLNISNIFCLFANALSASPSFLSGFCDLFRSIFYAIYKIVGMVKAWGVEGKQGIEKNTFFEKAFIIYGFLYAVGILVLGILLGLTSFFSGTVKSALFIFSWIFSGLALIWNLWNLLIFYATEQNIVELRKELNGFLENDLLSDREKFRGYLSLLRDKIMLSPSEIEKIETKIKNERADIEKQLRKNKPSITREEIDAEINKKLEHALHQENRFKIEKLISKTSSEIVESLFKVDELIEALDGRGSNFAEALETARKLIAKIDQTSYQNDLTNCWYKWLGGVCLVMTAIFTVLLGTVGSGGIALIAAVVIWSIISLLYIIIDCQSTNLVLTASVYNALKEEEARGHLKMKVRSGRECLQQTTGWEWLKEKNPQIERVTEAATSRLVA